MSAPKAGSYLLTAAAFYRVEGEGDDAVRRRYKRGDKVQLSKAEAARLAVPTPLAPASFVAASEDADIAEGADLVTSPELGVNRTSEANQLQAESNTGLNTVPEGAGILSPDQLASQIPAGVPLITGAGATAQVLATDPVTTSPAVNSDGKPARSATVEVWKDYAVKVGAVKEADAGDLTKAQLQSAVADHEAKTAGQ